MYNNQQTPKDYIRLMILQGGSHTIFFDKLPNVHFHLNDYSE